MSEAHHAATTPVGIVVLATLTLDLAALLLITGFWPLCLVFIAIAVTGFCASCFFFNRNS